MEIITAYHGTDYLIRSVEDIKINERSHQQFFGPAFYLTLDKENAFNYGKYIFEVKFNAENVFQGDSFFDIRTQGTFGQFLDMVRKYPEEFLSDEVLNDDSLDDDDLEYVIDKYLEENEEKYFQEYLEEQGEIRCELEEDYDGVFDGSQYAIYFPQKVILEIKLIKERPY